MWTRWAQLQWLSINPFAKKSKMEQNCEKKVEKEINQWRKYSRTKYKMKWMYRIQIKDNVLKYKDYHMPRHFKDDENRKKTMILAKRLEVAFLKAASTSGGA